MKSMNLLLRVLALTLAFQSLPGVGVSVVQAQAVDENRFQIPANDDGLPGEGPIRRYDWFQQLWEQRRSLWARQAARDQGAVVFLGDSITQGWGEQLRTRFPGMKVANRGISGDTTRGVLIRLEEDVLAVNPSGIVLLIGTNDLEEGASPETIAGNLKLILERLKAHNADMPILLCNVFPSSTTKKRPAEQIKRINELYAAATKGDAQVMIIDTWRLFANAEGDAKPEEFPDLLHPNEAGYAKWAAAIRPVLELKGLLPVEPDDFEPEPGFESLLNGVDLTGWRYRPTTEADIRAAEGWKRADRNAPPWPVVTEETRFDGLTATPDGRFVASNGRLVVTIPPEGRKIQKIWTNREFPKDFVLKLEFRAIPYADSGIYLREPQLQCRDYLLAGPYQNLKNYRPLDWNEIVVTVKDNVAHCTCNGEVLEAEFKLPENGPIGLEGDRGQMEYRRIRVRELP